MWDLGDEMIASADQQQREQGRSAAKPIEGGVGTGACWSRQKWDRATSPQWSGSPCWKPASGTRGVSPGPNRGSLMRRHTLQRLGDALWAAGEDEE
jgi:hypothetical protein